MSDGTLPRRRRRQRLTGCVEPCRECGKQIGASHYGNGIGDRIKKYRVCFKCDFWLNVLGDMYLQAGQVRREGGEYFTPDGLLVTIKGYVYSVGRKRPKSGPVGMGGREGRFSMLDGSFSCASRNTWCLGDVPENFRERIPDTAEWLPGYDLTPIKMGA